jgi:UDP-N-acetylglucosamine 1-carboxyvinyltransferase
MKYLQIKGKPILNGTIKISGAKNAALPLIASTILSKNNIVINNAPNVSDINTLLTLLSNLGATYNQNGSKLTINTNKLHHTKATYGIVKTMRASILVLGPLLTRFNHCEVSLPGGCAIGQRPVDLHLKALEQMGAKIDIKNGYILASCKNGLKGTKIEFEKITVTGTQNIIMAASLANGETIIKNAAKEPEVVQLCEVLKNANLDIKGIGTSTIIIKGTNKKLLDFQTFSIIPDRIEAGTYLCAGAICNQKLSVTNIISEHLSAVIEKFEEMGFKLKIDSNTITIFPTNNIKPIQITTSEYPGFPTDMQAQFMALCTQAKGISTIHENLFENRYMHVNELRRLGSNISVDDHIAKINGPTTNLTGTDIMATDLRASSALILAALVSSGTTNVHRIYHIDRGYETIEKKLSSIGVNIKRYDE